MKNRPRVVLIGLLTLFAVLLSAQSNQPGLLTADELKKVVPPAFFFGGQSATVQMRNSAGIRTGDGHLVLAGLVDNSGYASDVAAKYQGFLMTEVKLSIEGSDLAPGAYGFGFTKQGKFVVMDIGNHDVIGVAVQTDGDMKRPVPLRIAAADGGYRLYAGRKWVGVKTP